MTKKELKKQFLPILDKIDKEYRNAFNEGIENLINDTDDDLIKVETILKLFENVFLTYSEEILSIAKYKLPQIIEKDPPQPTERERAYLKAYSYDFEWIARGEDGRLYVYRKEPYKNINSHFWDCYANSGKLIEPDILSFIKWEDEEPYNIKDLLREE